MPRQRIRWILSRQVGDLQSNIIGVYSSNRRAKAAIAKCCAEEERIVHAIDPDCEYRTAPTENGVNCETVKNKTVYSTWKYTVLRFTEDETALPSAAREGAAEDEGEGEA